MEDIEELTKEDVKGLAQWLAEAFPKKYKLANSGILVDTREGKSQTEFMVILQDHGKKRLHILPKKYLQHILEDVKSLEEKGAKEFEPARKLGTIIHFHAKDYEGDQNEKGS